jgi:flagellar hook-basal body complex protein FliE
MEIKGLSLLDNLRAIQGVQGITTPRGKSEQSGDKSGGVSFAEIFKEKIEETNRLGIEADRAIERAALGQESNPHSTLIAVQKAEISLSLMLSVKDRIERAYQELVRTQF